MMPTRAPWGCPATPSQWPQPSSQSQEGRCEDSLPAEPAVQPSGQASAGWAAPVLSQGSADGPRTGSCIRHVHMTLPEYQGAASSSGRRQLLRAPTARETGPVLAAGCPGPSGPWVLLRVASRASLWFDGLTGPPWHCAAACESAARQAAGSFSIFGVRAGSLLGPTKSRGQAGPASGAGAPGTPSAACYPPATRERPPGCPRPSPSLCRAQCSVGGLRLRPKPRSHADAGNTPAPQGASERRFGRRGWPVGLGSLTENGAPALPLRTWSGSRRSCTLRV